MDDNNNIKQINRRGKKVSFTPKYYKENFEIINDKKQRNSVFIMGENENQTSQFNKYYTTENICEYKFLKKENNIRKTNLSSLTLKNLEISEDEEKNIIVEIIELLKNNIKKLKIIGGDFNFLFKRIKEKQIEFSKLEKLILYIDKEKNEEEEEKLNNEDFCWNDKYKILYLENNYKLLNYKSIKKIDLQIFSISSNDIKDIMKIYNNLYELY